ncbi:DUF4012 domain-containing protein [Arthrobacter sp. Z1-9]
MTGANEDSLILTEAEGLPTSRKAPRNRRWRITAIWVTVILAVLAGASAWVGLKALVLKDNLQAAADILPDLREDISSNRAPDAAAKVAQLRAHTGSAREAASDPLWTLASALPWIGPNFSAAAEVSRSVDDVATLAVDPLSRVFESLEWGSLMPKADGADLEPLRAAAPRVSSAAHTIRSSADRLARIESASLLPPVAGALDATRSQLAEADLVLQAAASAATLVPEMLGADRPQKYLLLVQNNAELRASGGIPASVAVITVDAGKLSLSGQTTAEAMGTMAPIIKVDAQQEAIYSTRVGKFMQDVNLTPDFPTSAATARSMWQQKTGETLDGVVSLDPVALSYLLKATGPVELDPLLARLSGNTLPSQLTAENVVPTLLSDVYARIPSPAVQDIYFAGVAKQIFDGLSSPSSSPEKLLRGLTQGATEGRILMWSADSEQQTTIARYPLGGSISGGGVSPAEFGVYFNDGTGAKMDYYVKRTVQLIKECPRDGYEQVTVRVTGTNTAAPDAGAVLPEYVTAGGAYGVPAGSVQTNIVAYGPVQAYVETAHTNGQKSDFGAYLHDDRPVGVLAVRLAPGESRTVDFTFGKIIQHTEPNLVVTPTVQQVNDVILPTQAALCG